MDLQAIPTTGAEKFEWLLSAANFKTKPYQHQLDFLHLHGAKPHAFLSAEMGTGKSWCIINNMALLWRMGLLDTVVVFAPNGVHTNWTKIELPKHMPAWVDWKAAAWVSGMNKGDTRKFESIFMEEPRDDPSEMKQLRILCVNWETLDHLTGRKMLDRFTLNAPKLMMVGDEPSGYVKNPSSARFKALLKLKYRTKFRRMMDGTPITQGPFDAFAPYNFLNKTILGESYVAFKAEYAEMIPKEVVGYDDDGNKVMVPNPLIKSIMDRNGSKRVPQIVQKGAGGQPKYKNLDKLQRILAPHTFRVLKRDCLDLPEKIYKQAFFELTPQQRVAYKKAEDELRVVYQNQEASFAKLAAVTKLAQITRGFFIHPDAQEPVRIEGPNPAMELLVDRVDAITRAGGKVIVWARFHAELEEIERSLAHHHTVSYHGRVKRRDREDAKVEFQEGEATVMIAQQQAGGTGVTWTAARETIYFSNTFSLRDRLQSEDRNHRIGQAANVTYTDLIASGTIDERIWRALAAKKDVADLINGDGAGILNDDLPF